MKITRIAATSDFHGKLPSIADVPECDILIIAGDVGPAHRAYHNDGKRWVDVVFRPWLESLVLMQRTKHIIGIAGNHDRCAERDPQIFRELPWTYLHNDSARIMGLNVWGSPYTPPFMDWSFMATDDELAKMYEGIPINTDILITHGPPLGILDENTEGIECGSHALRCACRRVRPLLHVFGHIHEQGMRCHGSTNGSLTDDGQFRMDIKQTTHANVAAIDADYRRRSTMFRALTIESTEE